MRLTVIKDDGVVSVDGDVQSGIDLSSLPSSVHAIQWYGEFGEVEHKDPVTNKMLSNEEIKSLSEYLFVVDLWSARKEQIEAELAAIKASKQAAADAKP